MSTRLATRRARPDAVVVGGGVVGAAAALALAQAGLDVTLLEAREPPHWSAARPDLRVYAFAPDNAALLDGLGVWAAVREARAQPYRHMRVWDAAGGDALRFDADALARRELGWIVEHGLLVDRLWAALAPAGVRVRCPARVAGLEAIEDGVSLQLDDGTGLEARLLLAADGADSSVRGLAGIACTTHAYGQQGVVAYVTGTEPHAATAWQRFLPTGPLALLPVADLPGDATGTAGAGHRCSIVWTLPDAEATRVLALPEDAFAAELTAASGGCLGTLRLASPRAAFPLRRQLAASHRAGRVLLLGDAAHVVHPLAGQGVNLGLRDVAALQALARDACARNADVAAEPRLQRWARGRQSENALAAHAFGAINAAFSNDVPAATLLRGPLLGLAGRLPGVSHALWRHAAGG